MSTASDLEQMIAAIRAMDRQEVSEQLLHFHADFPMDFTPEYLDRLTLERLQHILLAAHLYQVRKHQKVSA